MIVGTAGHIDHGKTTLVKALTGVETDRLKEEQARGMSIEVGYAYTPLANEDILGFVDVPGHEKLVHTMAAGASGIDFGLLVIAADDGIMPQTREHLAILSMLGIRTGAIALTKRDRVSAERLAEVESEIRVLLSSTFLQDAPLFPLSAATPGDAGVAALRDHLHAAAQAMTPRDGQGLFRLAIDRVFTLKGHGTVVTGTVHGGTLHLDDENADLRLMPGGQKLRVRSIHAQNQASQSARAGQRCALNLGGADKSAIRRGDWVADARCFLPSRNIDVQFHLLPDAAELRTWSPVHIHLGAAHYVAHAVPLSGTVLSPGDTGWVQLVFDQPVCAMLGDRYIARDAQARQTIGGGMVLDPNAPQRKRRSQERLAWLQSVAALHHGNGLLEVLRQAPHGLDEPQLVRVLKRPLEGLPIPAEALWVSTRNGRLGRRLILRKHWAALTGHTLQVLGSFHERWPDEPGVDTARLRRMACPTSSESLWLALRDTLLQENRLSRNGPWLHLPDHAVVLSPQEAALADRLLPALQAGGFNPPWVRDLAGQLNEEENVVRQTLLKVLRRGDIYQVVRDLFYHREQVLVLAQLLHDAAQTDGVSAAEFRDLTGLGRKRAIQILEFFNRAGYTRRLQDRHILRRDSIDFWQQLS